MSRQALHISNIIYICSIFFLYNLLYIMSRYYDEEENSIFLAVKKHFPPTILRALDTIIIIFLLFKSCVTQFHFKFDIIVRKVYYNFKYCMYINIFYFVIAK